MTNQTPEPIRLPDPIPEQDRPEGTIEVSRTTIYYLVTATLFFVAGYIVAWAVFSSTTGGLLNEMKTAAAGAAAEAVSTGVARLPANGGQVAAVPTPTRVPNQKINIDNAPYWGPADAKVTIVEYSDFECPYCEYFYRNTYPLLKQYYSTKIRFVFRDFPLQGHPNALPSALAAQCANEQGKFWDYHDLLYNNQASLDGDSLISYAGKIGMDMPKFTDCYKSKKYLKAINASIDDGRTHFVGGTPTFFINGEFYEGAGHSFQELSTLIEKLLAA